MTPKIQFNLTALDKMIISNLVVDFANIIKEELDGYDLFKEGGFLRQTDDKILIAWVKDFRKRLINAAIQESKEKKEEENLNEEIYLLECDSE